MASMLLRQVGPRPRRSGTCPPAQCGIHSTPVAEAILEALAKGRREITVPRRNPGLLTARFLRFALPGVLQMGLRRLDPVGREVLESARAKPRGED